MYRQRCPKRHDLRFRRAIRLTGVVDGTAIPPFRWTDNRRRDRPRACGGPPRRGVSAARRSTVDSPMAGKRTPRGRLATAAGRASGSPDIRLRFTGTCRCYAGVLPVRGGCTARNLPEVCRYSAGRFRAWRASAAGSRFGGSASSVRCGVSAVRGQRGAGRNCQILGGPGSAARAGLDTAAPRMRWQPQRAGNSRIGPRPEACEHRSRPRPVVDHRRQDRRPHRRSTRSGAGQVAVFQPASGARAEQPRPSPSPPARPPEGRPVRRSRAPARCPASGRAVPESAPASTRAPAARARTASENS